MAATTPEVHPLNDLARAIWKGTAEQVFGPDRAQAARDVAPLVVALEDRARSAATGQTWPSETKYGKCAVLARKWLDGAYPDHAPALKTEYGLAPTALRAYA